jgi:hypothetical protein
MTIVLDEAHKYLTNSDGDRFNQSICSIIRQQRHLAARVIISTQEPTVVPSSMLELMSYTICHRFSSPSWIHHLCGHISTPIRATTGAESWQDAVVDLDTGEALLFSPTTICTNRSGQVIKLGNGYIHLVTRPRITRDGGQSILAVGGIEEKWEQDSESPDEANGSGPISPSCPSVSFDAGPHHRQDLASLWTILLRKPKES